MAVLPTSPEWTTAKYKDALPYMMQTKCFDYCVKPGPCGLTHFPTPCICMVSGTPQGTMPLPPP